MDTGNCEKNEVIRVFKRYLGGNENGRRLLGSNEVKNFFCDLFCGGDIIPRDAPDMVCVKGSTALIIEHFEFDSYRAGRKGSKSKQEQARIIQKFKSLEIPKEGLLYTDTIHGKNSYEDYIKNLTTNFNAHYKKIETYKQNLLKEGLIVSEMDIKVAFLIEDTSPLPCEYIERGKGWIRREAIEILYAPEFLTLLENSPKVDYVLSFSKTSEGYSVGFIDRNDVSLYKEESIDYQSKKFMEWDNNVRMSGFIDRIKNSKKN